MSRLAFTLKAGDSAFVEAPDGVTVEVKVTSIDRGRARLAIVAPASWRISRSQETDAPGERDGDAVSPLR